MSKISFGKLAAVAAISAVLVASASPAFGASGGGPGNLPLDKTAVFKTRVAHLKSSSGGGGAGSDAATTSGKVAFGGTPYTVGPTVTPTTTTPEAEEHIAVDPSSSSNLVAAISDFALRGGSNTTKYAVSGSGGTSWREAYVPLDASGLPATVDGPYPYNSDPVVAIDKLGNVYLADLYFYSSAGQNANGLYVSVGTLASGVTTLSAAATYRVAAQLDQSTTIEEDKEWIAVDNSGAATSGNVYVSWTRFTSTSDFILFSRSTDHGQTWSAPIHVSLASQDGAVQGSQVAVGPNGEVYVAYEVFFVGGKRAHYLAKSTDGGLTFSSAAAITPLFNELSFNSTYRKNSFASLAVSPTNGNVYALYAAQAGTAGAETQFIKSINGGSTFSSPIAINDISTGQQFMASLTVDGAGTLHASWFDTRNSGKSTALYDIYATRSGDNGATFAPNARVTPTLVNAGTAAFIGDYAGVAAAGGSAHPVWTSGGFNGGKLQTATLS